MDRSQTFLHLQEYISLLNWSPSIKNRYFRFFKQKYFMKKFNIFVKEYDLSENQFQLFEYLFYSKIWKKNSSSSVFWIVYLQICCGINWSGDDEILDSSWNEQKKITDKNLMKINSLSLIYPKLLIFSDILNR